MPFAVSTPLASAVGQLIVQLDFHKDAKPAEMVWSEPDKQDPGHKRGSEAASGHEPSIRADFGTPSLAAGEGRRRQGRPMSRDNRTVASAPSRALLRTGRYLAKLLFR